MSGETVKISQFCKLAWYNWIMYCLGTNEYPDERLHLGKYLGPVIDVGPAMTTKILQYNGEVGYQSMYHPLTVEEQSDPTMLQDMVAFRENAEECL